VVRRAERAPANEAGSQWEQTRDGVDGRYFYRLVERQRRQDARHPPRHHRLSGAGRPDRQHVVAASARDLHRATRQELAPNVSKIGEIAQRALRRRRSRRTN